MRSSNFKSKSRIRQKFSYKSFFVIKTLVHVSANNYA